MERREYAGSTPFLTEKGRKLIRHVLPRKIRGSITFGCEDPALTGQILGAVAIAYPLYGKGVAVYPRFEEKISGGTASDERTDRGSLSAVAGMEDLSQPGCTKDFEKDQIKGGFCYDRKQFSEYSRSTF